MDEKILREYLFKEAEIIQDIISRMGNNSFLIKGWAITLIVASLLVKGPFYYHLIAFFSLFFFWYFDAQFLRMERLYRQLYAWLVKNRPISDEFLLDMDRTSLEKRFGKDVPCISQIIFSKTLIGFYGLLLIITVFSVCIDIFVVPPYLNMT